MDEKVSMAFRLCSKDQLHLLLKNVKEVKVKDRAIIMKSWDLDYYFLKKNDWSWQYDGWGMSFE